MRGWWLQIWLIHFAICCLSCVSIFDCLAVLFNICSSWLMQLSKCQSYLCLTPSDIFSFWLLQLSIQSASYTQWYILLLDPAAVNPICILHSIISAPLGSCSCQSNLYLNMPKWAYFFELSHTSMLLVFAHSLTNCCDVILNITNIIITTGCWIVAVTGKNHIYITEGN